MEIKTILTRAGWESFLLQCEEKTFLDSWNWGELQKKLGNKLWRLGVFDGAELIATALVIKIAARRGVFLFVPHGPNIKTQNYNLQSKTEIISILIKTLQQIAIKEKATFIRVAPIFENMEETAMIFRALGFRAAPTHMHPELTWELDITPSVEELLAGMRKTTRYLIRQGQKSQEIEITQSKDINAVEQFYKLHQETVDRHHFVPFSLQYIKQEFESFAPDDEIMIFHGKYRGELVASAVIVFWQGIAYYHHGATSLKYPKIPVAHLLQWQVILEAKRRGCKKYNFWGIAPDGNKSHPWAGLTLFKTGFGGEKKEYVKTHDLPFSWKYWPVAIFEAVRRRKRGL